MSCRSRCIFRWLPPPDPSQRRRFYRPVESRRWNCTGKFGIERPRLAVAGLNPHAGEGGSLGREEIEIIEPAIQQLRQLGITVSGPSPADSLFHPKAREAYDAALCMYHDQALIPVKTLDFEGGINITLGLPLIRTSPDHGTAFNIAGSGQASARSLIAAIKMAGAMARSRVPDRPAAVN